MNILGRPEIHLKGIGFQLKDKKWKRIHRVSKSAYQLQVACSGLSESVLPGPDFGRYGHSISTTGEDYAHQIITVPPPRFRIFRPSYGPDALVAKRKQG